VTVKEGLADKTDSELAKKAAKILSSLENLFSYESTYNG
jgi:hypothetical protein